MKSGSEKGEKHCTVKNDKLFDVTNENLLLGVNFINILWARFLYKSKLRSFSLITLGFEIFWHQNIGKKCACKMLMKLTPYKKSASFYTFYNNCYFLFCFSVQWLTPRRVVVVRPPASIEDGTPSTSGENLNSILQAAFLYKNVLHRFSQLTVCLCNLLAKKNCCKSFS